MSDQKQQSGFLLINKPLGWTSFDVVAKLRGITKIKKIGHAGTLDPLATGLLIIAIGRGATKQISDYMKMDKVYDAQMELGKVSNSYDSDGEITDFSKNIPEKDEVFRVVNNFVGAQQQIPPMFSAKKVKGKKLYELARKGIEIERKPSNIIIHSIEDVQYEYPVISFKVSCSTGTYIRTLIHDIGQNLHVGGYMTALHRVQIGTFNIKDAHNIADINSENWFEKMLKIIDKP